MVKSKKKENKSQRSRKVKEVIEDVIEPSPEPLPGYQNRLEHGIEWTPIEYSTRMHIEKYQNAERCEVTFRDAFEGKLRKSHLQPFLDDDGGKFRENLEILLLKLWDLEQTGSEKEKICQELNNNVVDDVEFRIQKMAKLGYFNMEELLDDVKVIRVMNAKITELDKSLQHHHQLLILNLGINYLNIWEWKFIPRTLRVLNLHANFIDDLSLFTNDSCPNLVSLILSRNCFNDDSNFRMEEFCHINDLDLADNDILWPTSVLEALTRIPKLTSLTLCGNPFAVSRNYKTIVTAALPELRYLDSHPVKAEVKNSVTKRKGKSPERSPKKSAKGKKKAPKKSARKSPKKSAQKSAKGKKKSPKSLGKKGEGDQPDAVHLIFFCYRIMGLPPPSKEEVGCFHLEMNIPLLDPVRREFLILNEIPTTEEPENGEQLQEQPIIEQYDDNQQPENPLKSQVNESNDPDNRAGSKLNSQPENLLKSWIDDSQDPATLMAPAGDQISEKDITPKTNIPEETSIYKQLTLYKPTHLHQKPFETTRTTWSKMITFPAVKIPCPNPFTLRDTFRTVITVDLIYTKGPCKKATLEKKGNKKDKKSDNKSPKEKVEEEWRSVLATFRCTLSQPDWTKASQDFQWSSDFVSPYALEVKEDNFSDLDFGDSSRKVKGKAQSKSKSPSKSKKNGKKENKKKSAKKKGDDSSTVEKEVEIISDGKDLSNPIPTSLTIHVGFAVERSH